MSDDGYARLIYLGILLASLTGWLFAEYRGRMGLAARSILAWGMIFVGVMAGYGLWQDIKTDMMPRQSVTDSGTIEIPRAEDGHYYVTLTVNGQEMTFMADTGATNVVLSQDDARALGIDPDSLNYFGEAMTANGIVRTARVELPLVELGANRDEDIAAYVNDSEMDGSLLGMDYLGLYRIEIADNRMILRR